MFNQLYRDVVDKINMVYGELNDANNNNNNQYSVIQLVAKHQDEPYLEPIVLEFVPCSKDIYRVIKTEEHIMAAIALHLTIAEIQGWNCILADFVGVNLNAGRMQQVVKILSNQQDMARQAIFICTPDPYLIAEINGGDIFTVDRDIQVRNGFCFVMLAHHSL